MSHASKRKYGEKCSRGICGKRFIEIICTFCGLKSIRDKWTIKNDHYAFCNKTCSGKYMSRRKEGCGFLKYKGGWIDVRGYRMIQYDGRKVYEHRFIMETFLKKKLSCKEHVHHKNGIKTDNRIENLEVIDIRAHAILHGKINKK